MRCIRAEKQLNTSILLCLFIEIEKSHDENPLKRAKDIKDLTLEIFKLYYTPEKQNNSNKPAALVSRSELSIEAISNSLDDT